MLAHLKLAIACLGLWLRFAIEVGVLQVMLVLLLYVVQPLLGCEQAWTPSFNLMSFDMDSVQVVEAVFEKCRTSYITWAESMKV